MTIRALGQATALSFHARINSGLLPSNRFLKLGTLESRPRVTLMGLEMRSGFGTTRRDDDDNDDDDDDDETRVKDEFHDHHFFSKTVEVGVD